jgi:hypothetical protein
MALPLMPLVSSVIWCISVPTSCIFRSQSPEEKRGEEDKKRQLNYAIAVPKKSSGSGLIAWGEPEYIQKWGVLLKAFNT